MIARIVAIVRDLWTKTVGDGAKPNKTPQKWSREKRRKKIMIGWEVFERRGIDWFPQRTGGGRIIYREERDAEAAANSVNFLTKVLPVYAIATQSSDYTTPKDGGQGTQKRSEGGSG